MSAMLAMLAAIAAAEVEAEAELEVELELDGACWERPLSKGMLAE